MNHWLVTGAANGIGLAVATELLRSDPSRRVTLTGRCEESLVAAIAELQPAAKARATMAVVDLADADSCTSLASTLKQQTDQLSGVFNAAGFLHDERIGPEKRLEDISSESLCRNMAGNCLPLANLVQAVQTFLPRDRRAVLASLSARVGSISDNRLGGWYSYRMSKAAHNMLLKTLSIELARRYKHLVCVALHPGTVDTALSEPFQRSVPDGKLFTRAYSARALLNVIDSLQASDSGSFKAWDGTDIPW
ncbi:MAG: SDR family NAD(P)-dependent oxidoreductase [Pseudomonadaceae bacterium]|nr:SDR family NAD(P)-dependent oxidoreductase [Pseudomonadaceae bacterium]